MRLDLLWRLEVLGRSEADKVCWMPGPKRGRQTERQQGKRVKPGGERLGASDLGRSEAWRVRSA